MKAAVYTRYSSDLQSETSLEDQLRLCRRLVEQHGGIVVETYTDAGLSGASHLRPGYQRLLEDSRSRRFDFVIAEGLDRISRDQEHIAAFYKQMVFQGGESAHGGRGRNLRTAYRPQGNDEQPFPERPRAKNKARP